MKIKWLTFLILFLTLFSLTACSNDNKRKDVNLLTADLIVPTSIEELTKYVKSKKNSYKGIFLRLYWQVLVFR